MTRAHVDPNYLAMKKSCQEQNACLQRVSTWTLVTIVLGHDARWLIYTLEGSSRYNGNNYICSYSDVGAVYCRLPDVLDYTP
jgi:hypothetical protein